MPIWGLHMIERVVAKVFGRKDAALADLPLRIAAPAECIPWVPSSASLSQTEEAPAPHQTTAVQQSKET